MNIVKAAGLARSTVRLACEDLLVQRVVRDVGHCYFAVDEEVAAFVNLVDWVEEGVQPNGDNVLDPNVVDDWDYGCNFTRINRPYALPCP